jgi:tetratricopeptide (TPR) repeat protein
LGIRGSRSTGPGNEHAVVLQMIKDAVQKKDKKEISRILTLGVIYCSRLREYNRFKDASIATEDLISIIKNMDFNKEFVELAIINGECLRMTGQIDKALEIFGEVIDRNIDYLANERLAGVYLDLALIYEKKKNNDLAIDSAEKVQELSGKDSAKYLHAESIIVALREKDPLRKNLLQDLERKARSKDYIVVANNIALDLSQSTSDEEEKLTLISRILSKTDDPYNRIRAVINKANYLLSQGKSEYLQPRDYQLLAFSYSFLFAQRLTGLFTQCHRALWAILKSQQQTRQLLKIFRLSSFIWRIRGEYDTEKKFLEEIKNEDIGEVRRLNDERVAVDIMYFERRRVQSFEKA